MKVEAIMIRSPKKASTDAEHERFRYMGLRVEASSARRSTRTGMMRLANALVFPGRTEA